MGLVLDDQDLLLRSRRRRHGEFATLTTSVPAR
jgi:hypothetical protein